MEKNADAYRTIGEAADELDLPQHVLRFWETRFSQISPMKRSGGRRYYRPADLELLSAIRHLLYGEGYTIKGVQRILKQQGANAVVDLVNQLRNPQADSSGQSDVVQTGIGIASATRVAPISQGGEGFPSAAQERGVGQGQVPVGSRALTPAVEAQLQGLLSELEACAGVLASARNF